MQSLKDALEMVTSGDRDSETSQKHRVGGVIRDTAKKREVQTQGRAGELGTEEERAEVTQRQPWSQGDSQTDSERAGAERRRPMMPPGGCPTPRPPRCIHADLSLTEAWHTGDTGGWEGQPSTPWSCGWCG